MLLFGKFKIWLGQGSVSVFASWASGALPMAMQTFLSLCHVLHQTHGRGCPPLISIPKSHTQAHWLSSQLPCCTGTKAVSGKRGPFSAWLWPFVLGTGLGSLCLWTETEDRERDIRERTLLPIIFLNYFNDRFRDILLYSTHLYRLGNGDIELSALP